MIILPMAQIEITFEPFRKFRILHQGSMAMRLCVCVYIYRCVYIYVCLCMYIYIYLFVCIRGIEKERNGEIGLRKWERKRYACNEREREMGVDGGCDCGFWGVKGKKNGYNYKG